MAGRRPTSPPAGTVLRRLRKSLERGWKPGLTVLTGEDSYHLDAAQSALLEHLAPGEGSEFGLTVVGEVKVDLSEIVASARSLPMFASRRVVLARDVSALEGDPAPLVAYAEDPPPGSFLLVRAPKLDLRRPLHKALVAAGRVLEFAPPPDPTGGVVLRDVKELAAERGLSLERSVALFLADVCAGDLYRVSTELDKLDVWIGPRAERAVRLEDARQVVFGGGTLSGWEIADAVLERDLRSALTAVRRLVGSGDEPIRIVGGLAWRARTLLQAKAMLVGGIPRDKVIAAARAWGYRDRFLAGLKRYTLDELLGFPARLLEADRCLKSRSLDPRAVLESLVSDLIRPRPIEEPSP
jgi:DNA polymerase-3 subunit delta